MRRPGAEEYAPHFAQYIDLTRGSDPLQNLEDSSLALLEFMNHLPEADRHYSYAKGKWEIAQVIQHLIDTDVVFLYRALWLARNEGGDLAGFDHEKWAGNALKSKTHWPELKQAFTGLRACSAAFFHSFTAEQWDISGRVNGHMTSVRSIPFIMAGHCWHHLRVLREKYRP